MPDMSSGHGTWRGARVDLEGGSSLPYRRGYYRSQPSRPKPVARPPSPPLGAVLSTISEGDLTHSPDQDVPSARITGCEDVASYNWLNEKGPTVLVPGKPPAWTPPITNAKLKEDNGNYFRDPNAARHPAHPMEPAVQAILAVDHDFNATSVDIFACSSTLGNLLRFVRKIDTPFRMLVEAVGDTVFLVRRENTPTEPIQNIYGYGHAFPEAYTTWEVDVKGSECCQRVVRYDFGGLNCLMRFHADGYYKDLVDSGQSRSQRTVEPARIDNLEDMLVSAFDKSTIATRPSTPHKPLTVIQGGQRIPQSSIFDVKTRSIRKKDHENTLSEELPRLWLAQIPNFILAYHASGLFWEIQKRNVRHEIQDWERNNQDTLHRFAALLRKIIAFAHDRKDGRFELRRREVDVLELREQGGDVHSTLPTAVAARWVADPSILSEHPREGSQRPGSEIGSQPDKGHEHDHPSEGDKAAVVRGVS